MKTYRLYDADITKEYVLASEAQDEIAALRKSLDGWRKGKPHVPCPSDCPHMKDFKEANKRLTAELDDYKSALQNKEYEREHYRALESTLEELIRVRQQYAKCHKDLTAQIGEMQTELAASHAAGSLLEKAGIKLQEKFAYLGLKLAYRDEQLKVLVEATEDYIETGMASHYKNLKSALARAREVAG